MKKDCSCGVIRWATGLTALALAAMPSMALAHVADHQNFPFIQKFEHYLTEVPHILTIISGVMLIVGIILYARGRYKHSLKR